MFQPWDNELFGKAITGATGYILTGRRLHGGMVAPTVSHIGNKMAKVGAFGRTVYKAAKYINKSFSQKEKQMPPVKKKLLTDYYRSKTSPTSRAKAAKKIQRAWRSYKAAKFGKSKAKAVGRIFTAYTKRNTSSKLGAKDSKSKGFIAKGKRIYNPLDELSIKGIVVSRELGGVYNSTAAVKEQSVMVGHSVFGRSQLRIDLARAFVKMLMLKHKINLQDFKDAMNIGCDHTWFFYYHRYPGDAEQVSSATFGNANTFNDLLNYIANVLFVLADTNTDIRYLRVKCTESATGGSTRYTLDLRGAEFDIYCKSTMKIQNRTINTSGNNEDSDVDNVPLYGKSYTGSGNWIQLNNDIISPATNILTNTIALGFTSTSSFAEPQSLSFVRHAKKIGKVHIDPGNIQTSMIVYRKRFTFNSIIRDYLAPSGGSRPTIQIGKFRYIHVEKMLQSVETTDINGIKVAWEVDAKTAVAMYAKEQPQTTYVVEQSPL